MAKTRASVSTKLANLNAELASTKEKMELVKNREAKRLTKVFESVGFYEVEITDDELKAALNILVQNKRMNLTMDDSAPVPGS